jgi:hypothetical protein
VSVTIFEAEAGVERLTSQIVAVQLDKVEGIEEAAAAFRFFTL